MASPLGLRVRKLWAGVKPTCLSLSSEKSIRKEWAVIAGGSRVQSLWVQPVPRECVQGVPVAVEAERDTGADEGHPLLVALANKSSQADRQVRSSERTGTPLLTSRGA